MARQAPRRVRSVPPGQGAEVQPPRFCSDACKQAHWRKKLGPEERNRRRREAEARRARTLRVRGYHAEFDRITARTPLPFKRVLPLLRELAGVTPTDQSSPSRLYRAAAVQWHPDKPGGDHKVFQLLQEAFRLAKLSGPRRAS